MSDLIMRLFILAISLFVMFHSIWMYLDMKRTNEIFGILTNWRLNNDSRFMQYKYTEMLQIYKKLGWRAKFKKLHEDNFPVKSVRGDDVYQYTKEHIKLMGIWLDTPEFISSLSVDEDEFLLTGNDKTYTTSDKPLLNSIRNKWIEYLKYKNSK